MGNLNCKPMKKPSQFSKYYKASEKLGQGEFAKVYKCKRKTDNKQFAVKVINKEIFGEQEKEGLQHEIGILQSQSIRHPNIIKMIDIFESKRRVKLVLELCDHDLMDVMDQVSQTLNGHLTEAKCARIVYILAKTLNYLHENGIVHRDLKPENILFTKDGTLKLTDFGMAHFDIKYKTNIHCMRTPCGTPYYAAPEILSGSIYNYKVDYWSLGVILYYMLTGVQPFESRKIAAMYNKIMKGHYIKNSFQYNQISKGAKDLIKKLLNTDPKKRITAERILEHKWIRKYNQYNDDIPFIILQRQNSLQKLIIDNYATIESISK